MSADTDGDAPNTKRVQLVADVPREPDAYRRTDHVRQRQKYRSDPELKTWIIEEVIETGTCAGAAHVEVGTPTADAEDDYFARFTFTTEVWSEGTHEWTVVVGLRRAAFLTNDETHDVITAYCRCHDDEFADCDGGVA